ncbi:hypothetical protein AMJ80_08775 [bacterium SM23_31]|nr:MAG: hypothetical protein AMJ80_08775 [bacterium SM23_31]
MKKLVILILFSYLIINFPVCGFITSPDYDWTIDDLIQKNPQDLVVLVAVCSESYSEKGAYTNKLVLVLVLVDYYNPNNYKVIKNNSFWPSNLKFSHDKSKIIFCDETHYLADGGYQFFIYNVKDSTFRTFARGEGSPPLCGIRPFWNHDGTGFYFTMWPPPFSLSTPGYFFDITIEKRSNIVNNKSFWSAVYPETLIDENTLIVFSNDSLVTGQPPGFYLMDTDGNYLSRVNNPHLLGRSKSGMLLEAYDLDWNSKLGLLVYGEAFQGAYRIGSKISVTNLDGTYYRNYTSGENYDSEPAWGPDGKTIIFERRPFLKWPSEFTSNRLMILNIETGKVREFISPSCIDGAISLMSPDY